MITLPLTLKKKWFDMILSREKKEEYRDINDYWARRLFYFCHEVEWQCWEEMLCDMRDPYLRHRGPDDLLSFFGAQFRGWQAIHFVNGYGRDRPSFDVAVENISIAQGKQEWGAQAGQYYFVICLGEIL